MEPTGETAEQQASRRLFFALWPNDDVRQQLTELLRQNSTRNTGKPIAASNLHLTLIFLGSVKEPLLPHLRQLAGDIKCERFTMRLDTLGWFKKPRVVWLGSEHIPGHLLDLVSQLRAGSMQCGLPVDDFPFKVHVTLQRKVQRFQSFDVKPVEWDVDEFVLVQSFTYPEGVEYKIIDRWPLLEESL